MKTLLGITTGLLGGIMIGAVGFVVITLNSHHVLDVLIEGYQKLNN